MDPSFGAAERLAQCSWTHCADLSPPQAILGARNVGKSILVDTVVQLEPAVWGVALCKPSECIVEEFNRHLTFLVVCVAM